MWLLFFSNIAPPVNRKHVVNVATTKLLEKIHNSTNLPLHIEINNASNKRLKSKPPIWSIENVTDKGDMWKNNWKEDDVKN